LHPQARPVVVHESGIALFRTLTPTGRRDQPSVGARVRFRHEPPAFYGFLQTSPLADDALAIRILFPMNRARSLTSSDWVCQLRWANKKGLRAIALSPLQFVLSEDRRKLPGQDLNLEWQDQNLQCYRLHHRAVWGGGIVANTRLVSPGKFGGVSIELSNIRGRECEVGFTTESVRKYADGTVAAVDLPGQWSSRLLNQFHKILSILPAVARTVSSSASGRKAGSAEFPAVGRDIRLNQRN
jgi:hypothetical protein